MEENEHKIPDGWISEDFGNLISEKRKSKLKVSDATNFGLYPFFTSGEAILLHNEKQIDGENIFLATGGVANVKYFKGDVAYSTDTYAISTKDIIKTKFLFYYSQNIISYINLNYFQGSGLKHLQKKDIKKHKVDFPKTANEQSKIAEILSKVDNAILETEIIISKYNRIKTGLIQELLTKGTDEKGNIRNEKTHKFKDSPLGRIPDEWSCKTIDDISERLRSGVTPKGGSNVYQEEGIMLIRSQNVYPYGFKLTDVAYISDEINNRMIGSQLNENDVLLNITGASIGRATYVPTNFPKSNVNQHVCAIRLKDTNSSKAIFLSIFLNSIYGQNQIYQNINGSNREGINYTQIKEIKLPFFNSDRELEMFINMIFKIKSKIESEEIKLSKLKSTKTGLMQNLLSGKKRVTHLLN
jgi:type I restriction enzyme S subunit